MSKLKDMRRSSPEGFRKHIHRLMRFLESDKAKRWGVIALAVFMVFLMVFAVFVSML